MNNNRYIDMVYEYVMKKSMLSSEDSLVLGISGGADSVALLIIMDEICKRIGIDKNKLSVVHVNHMIRGAEADEDEEFVKSLCEKMNIGCRIYRKDIKNAAKEMGLTVEEAGRIYRYQCFEEESKRLGGAKIAVAHNKNDVAETILFNLARGCGLNGLSGIKVKRNQIIRPLLFIARSEIEEYLESINQTYRVDASNLTLDYDRNKIRHIVLPKLEEINSGVLEHLCELAKEAALSYEFIHSQAKEMLLMLNQSDKIDKVCLPKGKLLELEELLVEHIIYESLSSVAGKIKDITRNHVREIIKLLRMDTGKKVDLPYGIVARNSYEILIIERSREGDKINIDIDIAHDGEYNLPDKGRVKVSTIICDKETHIQELVKKDYTIIVDYDKIKGTLCIRYPEEGDYITIDKTGNTKKLSRIFIDNKIDRVKRLEWPVIAVGHEIIWVIGLRYNEAYRVAGSTQRILQIEYAGGITNGRENKCSYK